MRQYLWVRHPANAVDNFSGHKENKKSQKSERRRRLPFREFFAFRSHYSQCRVGSRR